MLPMSRLFYLYVIINLIRRNDSASYSTTRQSIEGRVSVPKQMESFGHPNWQTHARVLINYGEYIGFVREDGAFKVDNLPVGKSYIVEIAMSDFIFEPVRVDISSSSKLRARKLNLLQPSQVSGVAYPLKISARQPAVYFRKREEMGITDMLMNPMVLFMVVPLLIFMVLPKLMNTNDPELQKEMQQAMQMPKYEIPELSEVMANFWGGGDASKKKKNKPSATAAAIKSAKQR